MSRAIVADFTVSIISGHVLFIAIYCTGGGLKQICIVPIFFTIFVVVQTAQAFTAIAADIWFHRSIELEVSA
jgi:hypothetical protein